MNNNRNIGILKPIEPTMQYDWKKQNPFDRYIDSITKEEADKICLLA